MVYILYIKCDNSVKLARYSIFRGEYCWFEELEWLKVHYTKNDFQKQVIKLSLAAVVYHIWKARNVVSYQDKLSSSQEIVKATVTDMRSIANS